MAVAAGPASPAVPVTSPEYSGAWMDEVETRGICRVGRRLAEHLFIERLLRIERQRIIDKLLKDALRKEGE